MSQVNLRLLASHTRKINGSTQKYDEFLAHLSNLDRAVTSVVGSGKLPTSDRGLEYALVGLSTFISSLDKVSMSDCKLLYSGVSNSLTHLMEHVSSKSRSGSSRTQVLIFIYNSLSEMARPADFNLRLSPRDISGTLGSLCDSFLRRQSMSKRGADLFANVAKSLTMGAVGRDSEPRKPLLGQVASLLSVLANGVIYPRYNQLSKEYDANKAVKDEAMSDRRSSAERQLARSDQFKKSVRVAASRNVAAPSRGSAAAAVVGPPAVDLHTEAGKLEALRLVDAPPAAVFLRGLVSSLQAQALELVAGFDDPDFLNPRPGTVSADAARRDINVAKNRYKNILPYDHSRVRLLPIPERPGDYYNANHVGAGLPTLASGVSAYIAAQGPTDVVDFWRMVWDNGVSTVVMLANLIEGGKSKCLKYWPDEGTAFPEFAGITVSAAEGSTDYTPEGYAVRTLTVRRGGETRSIAQYHYTQWPDHGAPIADPKVFNAQDPSQYGPLLSYVKLVIQTRMNRLAAQQLGGPILVHCSAGVGRTGTFIASERELDIVSDSESGRTITAADSYESLRILRQDRYSSLQTYEQFLFKLFVAEFFNYLFSKGEGISFRTVDKYFKSFAADWAQKVAGAVQDPQAEGLYANFGSREAGLEDLARFAQHSPQDSPAALRRGDPVGPEHSDSALSAAQHVVVPETVLPATGAYVQESGSLVAAASDEAVQNFDKFVVAKYSFEGDREDDLSFKKGDNLVVASSERDGWILAQTPDGLRQGFVPGNYLEDFV